MEQDRVSKLSDVGKNVWNEDGDGRKTMEQAEKKASFGQRWAKVRPTKALVLWSWVAAIVLTMIVGFNWGGWVTGGAVRQRVDIGARDAVALRLAPMCVAQFNLDPQKVPKLAELRAITSSWSRPDYVKKQGWATMPGEKEPDSIVAAACAKLLVGS